MSLSDLASLGSFVSGVAVLASLVFLFFQMRQMTEQVRQAERNQQAAIRQGRAAMAVEMNLKIAEGMPDVYFPIARGDSATSPTHVRQFLQIAGCSFMLFDEGFEQYQEGMLSESAFINLTQTLRANMRLPGMRVAWERLRQRYNNQFTTFVDKAIAGSTLVEPGEVLTAEKWNADVATELAKR